MFPLFSRMVSRIVSCHSTEVCKYGRTELASQSRSYSKLFYEKCLPMTKMHTSLLQKRSKMQKNRRKKPKSYILPKIKRMYRAKKFTSYIPALLKQETRLDVIMARLHFTETVPQARQPICHGKVSLNNGLLHINPSHKVSHGDIISFKT